MSKALIRNVASGVLAQSWTALLGLVALPIYVRKLGPESYGLLSLCLTLVGVGGVMDLGIGRSLGKFIAAAPTADRDRTARRYVRTGITGALALALLAAVGFMLLAPWIAASLFRVPPRLQPTAVACVEVTAMAFPGMLLRMAL